MSRTLFTALLSRSVSVVLMAVGLAVAYLPRAGIDPEAIEAAAARPNPRYLKDALPELRRKQRACSRKQKGGKNRRKAREAVAKVHARVAKPAARARAPGRLEVGPSLRDDRGRELEHQDHAQERPALPRDQRCCLGQLPADVAIQGREPGVAFVEVDARGTSQECSGCGRVVAKDLSQRWHSCDCGCSLDRDENAARNILAGGLPAWTKPAGRNVGQQVKRAPRSRRLQATE